MNKFLTNIKSINYTLYLNHLLVMYAFLLPVSSRGRSTIFFIMMLLFILRGNYSHHLKLSFQNRIVQACLLFLLVHFIWLIGTDNFHNAKSIIDDMRYLIFPLFFLSFLDKRFGFRIIVAFIIGILFSEIISYLIYFKVIPYKFYLASIEIYKAPGVDDPTPFLDHSRYSVLLSIAIGIFLYSLLNFNLSLKLKFFSIVLIVITSINIIVNAGRIGYISLLVLLIFVIFLKYKFSLKVLSIFSTTIILFFILSFNFSNTFKNRIEYSVNSLKVLDDDPTNYKTSFGLRYGFWNYSLSVIKENPILGVGTGDYLDEVRNKLDEKHKYLGTLSHAHNEYVKTFLQFGLLGFFVYLNIYYQIFRYKYDNIHKRNILFIVTIGILVATMTSILGSKIYLPLLSVFIVISTSKYESLEIKYEKINLRSFLTYFVFILLFLVIALFQ